MLITLCSEHEKQAGQTILIVALSMLALIAMAALAIDVATLYVAKVEAQRAADAAALAGAKIFVTSGYTSYPSGYAVYSNLCNGSTGAADVAAQASVTATLIAGVAPTVSTTCYVSVGQNPQFKVQVSRTNLPVFLARIWGLTATGVTATATAEAYNPSNPSAPPPVQVAGLKPWLTPNCPPSNNTGPNSNCSTKYFVDPTTGSIMNSGSFIGQAVTLTLGDGSGSWNGNQQLKGPPTFTAGSTLGFFPLNIPAGSPALSCPSTSNVGCNNSPGPYYNSIACYNPYQFSCGQAIGPSGSLTNITVNDNVYTGSLQARTDQGAKCMIHASGTGLGAGQDIFQTPPLTPGQVVLIEPGTNNPDAALGSAQFISRSDSVVTVPLFDGSNLCPQGTGHTCTGTTTVVGFLQVGIIDDSSTATGGTVDAVILNAVACNTSTIGTTPISGGDVSPIPVRLVSH